MVNISVKLRNFVHERANGYCEYCRASEEIIVTMQIDHIQPIVASGKTEADNLCLACQPCNGSKSDFQKAIDPETEEEVPLFNPRTQIWSEYFTWSKDNPTIIIGLTETGRATIERLHMNNKVVIMARSSWRKAGWIPPSN